MPLQVVAGETCEVGYTLEGASENARVRVVAPDGYRVQVIETNYWSGKIVIYLPDAATDERIVVILSDEGNETVSRYIDLEVKAKSDVVFDLSANSYLIEAEGTSLRVMLITNIDYTVEIAEKDRTWISVETSRTDQREESLVFSFRPNSDVKSRQATVRLVDSEGNLLDSICFTQATSGSVNVRLERADVWTQVIWLSGSCASDVAQAGFRYRKQGDKEWVEVAGAGSSNGFSAHVEAEPETTYEIMACWRDEESRIHIVTTLPALKLPNGDFEEWNFSEEGAFWATSIVRGYPEMGLPQPTIRPGTFICRNAYGEVDNLLRGGSDFTASLIGAALPAEEIQIWTDIDGMHNNDPRVVDKTEAIRQLNFEEAAELAYFGAKILHPTCVQPAKFAGIPVRLKNTLDPKAEGTIIDNVLLKGKIKAVAAKDNITAIKIKSSRMLFATGFLRKVFEIFECYQTPIDMITTSEVGVSMSIDNTSHLNEIVDELKKYGTVTVDSDMCIVCVVGDLDWSNLGFETLVLDAMKTIPVRMISYGGSNYNISFLIKESDKKKALQSLSDVLFNNKK